MSRLTVLSKENIIKYLMSGAELRYYEIEGKVYVNAQNGDCIGAVRFETYLKLANHLAVVPQKWGVYRKYVITPNSPITRKGFKL